MHFSSFYSFAIFTQYTRNWKRICRWECRSYCSWHFLYMETWKSYVTNCVIKVDLRLRNASK